MAAKQRTVQFRKLHPAQAQIWRGLVRFNVLNCGRRFGKTAIAQPYIAKPMIQSGLPVGWFAPSYRILGDVWRESIKRFEPAIKHSNKSEMRIELINGGSIEFWSLDKPDVARGRKYARIVVDEAAMCRHLEEAWQAVIRPTLTDYRGDAMFLSTPKGMNFFHTLYSREMQGFDDWRSWTMPTLSNPFIHPDEIELARLDLPERIFQQEYEAKFLEDGAGVFKNVRGCVDKNLWQNFSVFGEEYVFGVDWGKQNDFTVITVGEVRSKRVIYIERFNQIDYQLQASRLMSLFKAFRPRVILAEENSIGGPQIDHLRGMGVDIEGFLTTNESKSQIINQLSVGIDNHEITYPDYEPLINELIAYEMARLPSGRWRYTAPDGLHDDCVISLALCWEAMKQPPMIFTQGDARPNRLSNSPKFAEV